MGYNSTKTVIQDSLIIFDWLNFVSQPDASIAHGSHSVFQVVGKDRAHTFGYEGDKSAVPEVKN
jgi:hypothetical protein